MRNLNAYRDFRHTCITRERSQNLKFTFCSIERCNKSPRKRKASGQNKSPPRRPLASLFLSSPSAIWRVSFWPHSLGGCCCSAVVDIFISSSSCFFFSAVVGSVGSFLLSRSLPPSRFHRCQLQISLLEVHFLPIRRRRHSPKRRIRTPLQGYLEDRVARA